MSEGPRQARFAAALGRLRAVAQAGTSHAGGTLPGERDLAASLGVSRTTLRRMLAILVDEGLLTHRQGVGTFVAAPPPSEVGPLAGFTDATRRLGLIPSSRDVTRTVGQPTAIEAMLLACSPDAVVTRLTRLRCIDGAPVAREQAVLPCWALADEAEVTESLYATLARQGVLPVRSLQRIEAAMASAGEREPLQASGLAIIHLQRTDYVADGRCCAFTRTAMRSDHFDLLVEFRSGSRPLGLATHQG